ncbi:uncharacterized protein [Nicotiana sylvestris]|uniref:uncharacterized protein n=1 Tax=Nicotiana sylvestris TaxID=4096 RepID=UPI00388CD2A2
MKLSAIPNEYEIKKAVFSLSVDSTASPDNYNGFETRGPHIPSLFIIAVDVLSRSLSNLNHDSNFSPFSMPCKGSIINHLAYADDIIVFSSGNITFIKIIMKVFKAYEMCSGQLVNRDKSFFLTAPNTCAVRINRMRDRTGFMDKYIPFNYLCCPLYVERKKIAYFDNLVHKVIKRSNDWHGKMLSYGGRLILIKSVLQYLPIYTLSSMNPPKATFYFLEKHFVNSSRH